MEIQAVVGEMLSLFLILAVGYLGNKMGFLNREATKVLSRIIVNVTLPALILASVMGIEEKIAGWNLLILLTVAFLSYGLLGLVAFLTPKALKAPGETAGVYAFMAIFGNVAFIGFPIITAVYGSDAVFYAALFNIPFNLLIFSVGIMMLSPQGGLKIGKRAFLNPSLAAAVLALILYLLPIEFPRPLVETASLLGGITVPGAMLVVGASLGAVPLGEVFRDARVYLVSLIKLIVCPFLILACFGPFIRDPLILGAAVITTAMPVATNTAMLSMEYGGDETLASKGIFISTLLSIATMPLVIMALKWIV
ncbi:MAG: AEC family transporter [Bacillota bacterium]|nr:AEC family transporter [Bacillota bacterium]